MDFLMSWQSGVKNVIASSGTALTADHLRSLHRFAEELIVSFDNDTAGSDAAERAIDLAEANDFSVKVAIVKNFKDMADAVQADPANAQKVIAAAVAAPVFYFEKYLPKDPVALKTREGLHALRAVLAKLKNIASPVERDFWLKDLATRTGIAEKILQEEAARANAVGIPTVAAAAGETEEAPKREVARAELLVEALFAAALAKNDFAMLDDCSAFFDPPQKEIFRILQSGKTKSEDPSLDETIGLIVLRASGDLPNEEIEALKAELSKEYYKERRKILAQAVKNAEARGNQAELAAALEELKNLPAARAGEA